MRTLKISPLLVLTLLAGGCAKVDKDDVASSAPTSNVETTETTPGVVTGHFKQGAGGTQRLVGSANGNVSEDFIDMAPGTIAVDTDVTMQEGSDLGAVLPAELGLGENVAVLGGSTPVMLSGSPATPVAGTFAINIPLPLDDATSGALRLTGEQAKAGILYMVKTAEGNKVGFYPFGSTDLVGAYAQFKGARFGWFRIVVLSAATAAVEKDTQKEPAAK